MGGSSPTKHSSSMYSSSSSSVNCHLNSSPFLRESSYNRVRNVSSTCCVLCSQLVDRDESRNANKVLRFRASLSEHAHEVELA